MSVFFVPLIFFVLTIVWILFWALGSVYIATVDDVIKAEDSPFATVDWTETTSFMWWYHIFGLFWVGAFIIGVAQFIIAAAACMWYYSHGGESDTKAKGSLMQGLYWVFRYHLGSIAFGALIIAIVQMIKLIFEYWRKKVEKTAPDNALTKCIICCARCCIWCLDRFVKFITKNAYIQIVLTNKSFCPAAWGAFCLVVRNFARFSIITGIGMILMLLGKAVIMTSSGVITYLLCTNTTVGAELSSPIGPCVVVVIISYMIGSIFLSVYSFASTAILHSYLLDEELKGGHTPPSLQPFIDSNDKIYKKDKDTKSGQGVSSGPGEEKGTNKID